MGWSIGFDSRWNRDIGYGVPAYCDEPGCDVKIDRGLAYVCGGEPYGGDDGCGLFFCEKHRTDKCVHEGYVATKDHPEWIWHKLTDPSWQEWRNENPEFEASARASGLSYGPALSGAFEGPLDLQ